MVETKKISIISRVLEITRQSIVEKKRKDVAKMQLQPKENDKLCVYSQKTLHLQLPKNALMFLRVLNSMKSQRTKAEPENSSAHEYSPKFPVKTDKYYKKTELKIIISLTIYFNDSHRLFA